MAESSSYPQIPSTVWAGVWKILHDSPSRKIDENVLAIELGVQKTAAKQYINELTRLGLFGSDGATTDIAKQWRQDGNDPDVIKQILEYAYPQELRELAPPGRLDRDKITRWFVSQGLGSGAAGNKAATYMRVANGVSATDSSGAPRGASDKPKVASGPRPAREKQSPAPEARVQQSVSGDGAPRQKFPDLNVNVQIHISADSTKEQIDAIFSAMRKYFDGSPTT